MKIIHTSDWHLGQTLYEHDRSEEHYAMLRQMADIVAAHRPDAFLLAGDLFHSSQPSAAVQRMLADALIGIKNASPSTVIVTIAGNHDSPSRHDIFASPWRSLGVHTFGYIDREHPESQIIEIPGRGWIGAVPYVNERSMPEGYYSQVLDGINRLNVNGLPVVLMAHTTISGCDFTGHDMSGGATIGGIDALPIADLGEGYDYVALGHIHRQQSLGDGRVRYCGTPLPVSFDEQFEHSLSLVEIDAHGNLPVVTRIPISNPRPLVTLPSRGFAGEEECLRLLADLPPGLRAYIRLNMEAGPSERPLSAIVHQARKLCEEKGARFCNINLHRQESDTRNTNGLTVAEFHEIDPVELACRYAGDIAAPLSEKQIEKLRQVIDSLKD